MAVEVWIKNYQSIREAHLVIEGFTVISGPNNSGKSALMRALRGPLENTPGDKFVRHGAEFCSVKYGFPDGRTVEWRKGPKVKPTYIIDGDEDNPIYPGKDVPPIVLEIAGMTPVQTTSGTLWPQIAKQFTGQVFLMDKPGSAVADAIADVERVGALNKGLKRAEKEGRKATSTLGVRRKDLTRHEKELEHYEGLDEVGRAVEALETKVKHVDRIYRGVVTLVQLRQRLEGNREIVRGLEGVEDIEVVPSDRLAALQQDGRDLIQLEELREDLAKAQVEVEALDGVDGIEVVPAAELARLRKSAEEEIGGLLSLQRRMKKYREVLNGLEGVEGITVVESCRLEGVREVADEIGVLSRLRDQMSAAQGAVEALAPVEKIEDPAKAASDAETQKLANVLELVVGLKGSLQRARGDVEDLEQAIADRTVELEDATRKVAGYLAKMPGCPTCGRTCRCGGVQA